MPHPENDVEFVASHHLKNNNMIELVVVTESELYTTVNSTTTVVLSETGQPASYHHCYRYIHKYIKYKITYQLVPRKRQEQYFIDSKTADISIDDQIKPIRVIFTKAFLFRYV